MSSSLIRIAALSLLPLALAVSTACNGGGSYDAAAHQACLGDVSEDQRDCSDDCLDDQRACSDRCTDGACVSDCGDDSRDCIADCTDDAADDRDFCNTLYGA